MSGKLSFHVWKSEGILLHKTGRNPGNSISSSSQQTWDVLSFSLAQF